MRTLNKGMPELVGLSEVEEATTLGEVRGVDQAGTAFGRKARGHHVPGVLRPEAEEKAEKK